MILVDASIWIDHLACPNARLLEMFATVEAWTHPFVVGELAMGSLANRTTFLRDLGKLPQVVVATVREVTALIEWERLYTTGIGYIDAHLLASTRLTGGARLWTRDRRLHAQAERLGLAFAP